MKKLILLLSAAIFSFGAIASNSIDANPSLNAKNMLIPIGQSGETISLIQLSTIQMDELEALTGTEMKFMDRLAFKAAQKKLSKAIDEDGNLTNKKLVKKMQNLADGGFHLGGFALGVLLGLIGVLIAYLINTGDTAGRRKWAWIGFGVLVVVALLVSVL